jgi:hypothetical protein
VCTLSLITILCTLLRYAQHQNLVPTTHHPKCTSTFKMGNNGSPAYMYNYKCSRSGTLHSPPPYFMHCPQCIVYTYTYNISKIFKKMWILYPNSILPLTCCILRTVPGPLDPYQLHVSILELFVFLIQYANQLHLKIAS